MDDLERWRGQIEAKLDAIHELQQRLDSDITRIEQIHERERHSYVTRDYYEQRHETLAKATEVAASRMTSVEAAQNALARLIGLGVAIVGVVVAIVAVVVRS